MSLSERHCKACLTATAPLTEAEYQPYLDEVPGWQLVEGMKIQKSLKLSNFKQSLDLANKIGELAENEGHHPDLLIAWGQLRIDLWTHKVNGLTEADFVLAAKIDRLIEKGNRS